MGHLRVCATFLMLLVSSATALVQPVCDDTCACTSFPRALQLVLLHRKPHTVHHYRVYHPIDTQIHALCPGTRSKPGVKSSFGTICKDELEAVHGVVYNPWAGILWGKDRIKPFNYAGAIANVPNDMQSLYQGECGDHHIFVEYPEGGSIPGCTAPASVVDKVNCKS
jgi:hypothetical protein